MKIKRGSTSVRRLIFIADSSSTTGAGLANLTHSTSGLVAYYYAGDLSNEVQITLVTATLGTFVSRGFVAVDDTNMPGWYEVGIPDAALDGGNEVCIQYRGAANMVPVNIYIQLDAVDYQTDAFGALKPTTAGRTLDVSANGEAGIDLANVGSPTSTLNLSGTTIKAVTDGVTVTTNNDKTGYSLTQAFPSNFSALAITAGGAVTVGTNNDKTGYALTQAFPSNFAALGINGSGHISRVTLVDTTTTNTDMRGTNNAALASSWTATRAGYLDSVLIAANSNRTVQVTGSHHVAADIHELQPAVIDSTRFAAGAIDSNALAASAATEIATAVGSLTQLVDLTTMIVNDGTANARFSTSALQNAPSGGGGGGTGTGARTVVVTVTLSASPVEGASVRLTKAAETYVGSTNASGQVTFNIDDGTWTVAITSPGATFAGASLVVDDDEAVSYSLTAISITPSPATQITGYYTCYSHLGVVEAGVSITMQLVGLAQGSVGLALDNRLRTVTSDANGVAQFTNLFPGCRYKVYRGAAENKAWYVSLPDTVTGDPVELGSIYGDDE